MNTQKNNDIYFDEQEGNTLKDYIILFRNNLPAVLIILVTSIVVSVLYALRSPDIYSSQAGVKITKTGGNILQSPLTPEFSDFGSDRFIANEIEILKSINFRERVAQSLLDTFINLGTPKNFVLLFDEQGTFGDEDRKITSTENLIRKLERTITVEQKRGLDIITISAESQSPEEAALIANTYAKVYKDYNLEINRDQLTYVRKFLDEQRKEKREQLNEAEEILRNYQEKGGIIALDAQANNLIAQVSDFEAQRNAVKIELSTSDEILKKLKDELQKQDPKLVDYLESVSSESYIKALQEQIAELQLNKDLAMSKESGNENVKKKVAEYENKIQDLRNKLNEKIKVLKSGIFASSPEEVKSLTQKIIEEEIKNGSLKIRLKGLEEIVNRYEERFNRLPKTSLELARFQRNRESLEKLYTLVEERYQEALINEQSQPGNVLIIDDARIPKFPSKPNRILIILIGTLIGGGLAFAYVFTKNYFDNKVKSPEDLRRKNINVLAWIPEIEGLSMNGNVKNEFIVTISPDSIPAESFRALRTRVQFAKPDKDSLRTILITSPAPQEGKSTIALNLAGSFAIANKKTLLIDADLRRPRLHKIFDKEKSPGLVDFLVGETDLNKVIHKTKVDNLYFLSSGTIPPNPSEMLDSKAMENFILQIKNEYDYVIIDSPPVVAVTDAEILARKVDGVILVCSAEITELALIERGIELLKSDSSNFIGAVLNNFSGKAGYSSYYKYYYYYSTKTKV
ncbi:MAG: polysaccharide biosynthesis tyrosine autokinase [Ignavibacterium album]|uniref:GumC family protein n=1 Tax=Ignavibacterium album TaxID=591197 RepID=UPI0026F13EB4|nr:polysaccharide biosynthesis tyrosine autokinase [Ignavibacterium album]MBI5663329.1 polysaccharide biosynthesis tyrosine autokinase [Ignavibacterium album]